MKKIITYALIFAIAFSFVPVTAPTVAVKAEEKADTDYILNSIDIELDLVPIDLNTAYSESMVDYKVVLYGHKVGKIEYSYYPKKLMYYDETNNTMNDVTSTPKLNVSIDRQYVLCYEVIPNNYYHYIWDEEVNACIAASSNQVFSQTNTPNLAVNFNGNRLSRYWIQYTDNYDKMLYVYVPLTVSTDPRVTKLEIPYAGSYSSDYEPGKYAYFYYNIEGTIEDKSVTWSVSGNTSSKTAFDRDESNGVDRLYIAEDEEAVTLEITLTANADPAPSRVKKLIIFIESNRKVEAVTIPSGPKEVTAGKSYHYEAEAKGTMKNSFVKWSLKGNNSPDTNIDGVGRLVVAEDETASVLTITATAWEDSTKSASIEVTVHPKAPEVIPEPEEPPVKKMGSVTFADDKFVYTYTGNQITPAVVVTATDGTVMKNGKDYTITYNENTRKAVGNYFVFVTPVADPSATHTLVFSILPKKTTIKSISVGSKKMTVKATSKASSLAGSALQFAYQEKGSSTWKYVTTTAQSKTITKLKKGKYYYIKVRAYKSVSGLKYYGDWSKVKLSKKIK